MTDTLTTLRAALEAMQTGHDAVCNYAEDTHEKYAGYYPERHAAADRDVVEVQKAIAYLGALIATVESQPVQEPEADALKARIRELCDLVRKAHAAKGRHHTQLAMCDLLDAVGLSNERPKK